MYSTVHMQVADGVAEIRLDRPAQLNAISVEMFAELEQVGATLNGMKEARVAILHGAGRGFCSGLDTTNFNAIAEGEQPIPLDNIGDDPANLAQRVVLQWRALPMPVIAAVHGVAIGGGFQLMLGADIRLCTTDARMAVAEIRWGLIPDMGGLLLMRESAGRDVISDLCFTGRTFLGEEALQMGFVTALHADPLTAARALAREIAARNPQAIRAMKRILSISDDAMAGRILRAEATEQAPLFGSLNQKEALAAATDRRPPCFAD